MSRPEEPGGGLVTHRDDGRNMQCKLLGLHYRGATVFLPQANIRRSREQCKFICIAMSRPEEPGGLGLTGTTGGGLERTGVLSDRKKHGYPSHKSARTSLWEKTTTALSGTH